MTSFFYKESFTLDEVCSHGCSHRVYYYDIVEVDLIHQEPRTIDYGGTPAKSVSVWYTDAEGLIYCREATWDGPGWPVDEYGEVWMPRPIGEVKKDLSGNLI